MCVCVLSAVCVSVTLFQEVVPITSPPKFIDTASDLAELCDLLKMEKELAVDLEVSGNSGPVMRMCNVLIWGSVIL